MYRFGSRADERIARLAGVSVETQGSDLDIGAVFEGLPFDHRRLASLHVALEGVFEPLTVDLVPLQRVDALFQFRAISGHRAFASDATRADASELTVMRRPAELAPIQRRIERDLFGFEVPR